MASLSTLDWLPIVRNTVTAVQSLATALINLTIGSVLRAIIEANAAVILWLQGLITYVLTLTRLATSSGSDVDTFIADFGFFRLPASDASGINTFFPLFHHDGAGRGSVRFDRPVGRWDAKLHGQCRSDQSSL